MQERRRGGQANTIETGTRPAGDGGRRGVDGRGVGAERRSGRSSPGEGLGRGEVRRGTDRGRYDREVMGLHMALLWRHS